MLPPSVHVPRLDLMAAGPTFAPSTYLSPCTWPAAGSLGKVISVGLTTPTPAATLTPLRYTFAPASKLVPVMTAVSAAAPIFADDGLTASSVGVAGMGASYCATT